MIDGEMRDDPATAEWAAALIHSRQTLLPRRLEAPGPDDKQLQQILAAAGDAPDHRQLLPWRLVLVPPALRPALADAFEQALLQRDAAATAQQCEQAREKAFRSPALLLAIVRLGPDEEPISDNDRIVSAGCALQNMLLMATALGFGSALTSGKAMQSQPLRVLFRLQEREQALCFLSLGTPTRRKPLPPRPGPERYFSVLGTP